MPRLLSRSMKAWFSSARSSSTDSVISISSRSGGRPEFFSADADDVEQLGLLELDRRQVHRDLDVVGPPHRVVAGATDHPLAERHDQPGLLGERNELVGRDQPAGRMPPAHQRFHAAPLPGLDVEERLVVHLELASCDGVAQIAFEGVAGFELGRHRLVVDRVAVPARRFRPIERKVRLLQQLLLRRCRARARIAIPMLVPISTRWPGS